MLYSTVRSVEPRHHCVPQRSKVAFIGSTAHLTQRFAINTPTLYTTCNYIELKAEKKR